MKYNDEQIQNGVLHILTTKYKFMIASVSFVPVGQESYSYIVALDSGKKLFVKFCEEINAVNNIDKVNQLLLELSYLDFVVPPVVIDGKSTFPYINGKVYVYPYIEGYVIHQSNHTFDNELTNQLTEIMSAIHNSTNNIKTELIREDFNIDYTDKYTELIDPSNENKFDSKVWKLLQENTGKIVDLVKRYSKIGRKYQKNKPRLVLTHGDITGMNIIRSQEGLKLTDWDGAFAPKERDFIFLFDNSHFSLEKYYQLTGEKSYDPLLKEYYTLDWSINSIIGNFENILNNDKSDETKKEYLDEIIEYLNYY